MLVNLVFDYYADEVDVPEYIAEKLKEYQNECYEWLFDESNDHDFWIEEDGDKKSYVGICSEAFIYYLNIFVIKDDSKKAYIIRKDIDISSYNKDLPTIFY